jgi:hypothetical protein
MCRKRRAPAQDPLIAQAAQQQAQLARESFDFYKNAYENHLLPMEQESHAMAQRLMAEQEAASAQQREFAQKQQAYYEEVFQPIERKMAEEAMNYDSNENVQRRMGIAAAAQNQQWSNATQQNARLLSRYGLNPNSSAFASTNAKLLREQALGTAGAQTGAAFDTMDKAIALRAGAANFGRNMPNTALQYHQGANASNNMAMNFATQDMANARANTGIMGQGFDTAMSGWNSAGNLANMDYQNRLQASQQKSSAFGSLLGMGIKGAIGYATGGWAGAGNMIGGAKIFADGGKVHNGSGPVDGPGGPVDDKVPALLSDGEYVLPADTVQKLGRRNLDKLVDKTHTPAAIQRAKKAKRRNGLNRGK